MIGEEDALHHAERHLISNLVGSTDMRVEVRTDFSLSPHDTILLASDGLFDNVRLDEIVEIVRAGNPEVATRKLASVCHARMMQTEGPDPSHADDLTILLYRPRQKSENPA